ncbi:MAG: type II/IV secretion system protein [Candidatus Doudnabacteria bacterium]|nr:type II/IV secretion system protein [Candidatus Doudnabacteria bacterium]
MLTQNEKETRLKQVYQQLDRKFEEEETQRKAKQQKTPYINLFGFPIDSAALALLTKAEAESAGAVVFFKEGRNLKLGVLEKNQQVEEVIKKFSSESYYVEVYFISESSYKRVLDSYSKIVSTDRKSQEIEINQAVENVQVESLKQLGLTLAKTSATQMIDMILGSALNLDSSDIHVEPEAGGIKLRYRIDGVLADITILPKEAHHQLISRIKILSKLKLNIIKAPQDGSFSLTYNSQPVDIRVSVLPSAFGESVVMRLLRQDKGGLKFEELGIADNSAKKLLAQMEKPNGMILTTGPTGSGKTTTLYAILNKLNEPGVKIITLEDPVEYKITGITQTPVDARAGLTFAAGLRAILRQDPDVVMVGEMRDLETAEIGCQAALTGHIVLSTLHTNDAAGAIPRLLDLGVKSFVLAPAINAVIAQRLVRKICPACKKEATLSPQLRARVEMIISSIPKNSGAVVPKELKFHHSEGCKACKGLGYKGRIGVYEIFTINDEIEKLILKGVTHTEVRASAIAAGMVTMAQDGILKALAGITDVEEVFRVTEE